MSSNKVIPELPSTTRDSSIKLNITSLAFQAKYMKCRGSGNCFYTMPSMICHLLVPTGHSCAKLSKVSQATFPN